MYLNWLRCSRMRSSATVNCQSGTIRCEIGAAHADPNQKSLAPDVTVPIQPAPTCIISGIADVEDPHAISHSHTEWRSQHRSRWAPPRKSWPQERRIRPGGSISSTRSSRCAFSGKVLVNGGTIELGYLCWAEAPHRSAATFTPWLDLVEAYDGSQAWKIDSFQGRKDPESCPPTTPRAWGERRIRRHSCWGGGLQSQGHASHYLGTEDVDGTEAQQAARDAANGDITYVYLDPDYFLEVRTINRRIEHGVPHETVIDYGDYEQVMVSTSRLPRSRPQGLHRSPEGFSSTKLRRTAPRDDAQFHFPAARAGAGLGPGRFKDKERWRIELTR